MSKCITFFTRLLRAVAAEVPGFTRCLLGPIARLVQVSGQEKPIHPFGFRVVSWLCVMLNAVTAVVPAVASAQSDSCHTTPSDRSEQKSASTHEKLHGHPIGERRSGGVHTHRALPHGWLAMHGAVPMVGQ